MQKTKAIKEMLVWSKSSEDALKNSYLSHFVNSKEGVSLRKKDRRLGVMGGSGEEEDSHLQQPSGPAGAS